MYPTTPVGVPRGMQEGREGLRRRRRGGGPWASKGEAAVAVCLALKSERGRKGRLVASVL